MMTRTIALAAALLSVAALPALACSGQKDRSALMQSTPSTQSTADSATPAPLPTKG